MGFFPTSRTANMLQGAGVIRRITQPPSYGSTPTKSTSTPTHVAPQIVPQRPLILPPQNSGVNTNPSAFKTGGGAVPTTPEAWNHNLSSAPTIATSTYNAATIAPHATTPGAFSNHTTANYTDGQASTANINPNSLVSNQMNGLLASNSPYLTAARTRALQSGARRGLLNSSMTTGASEAAAINAALPIAQGNANAYGVLDARNQQNIQQTNLTNANAANNMSQFNSSAADLTSRTNANIYNQNAQYNASAVDAINKDNASMANQAAQFNAQQGNAVARQNQDNLKSYDLANQTLNQNIQLQNNRDAATMYNNYIKEVGNIQSDATMTPTAKTAAINSLRSQLNIAQKSLAAVNSMPVVTWL